MKHSIFTFVLFFIGKLIFAQQNFINVPSAEVTEKKKLFFQQQININEIIQSNTTIDYGLGKGFELGINVLGLNFSEDQKFFIDNDSLDKDPFNPLLMINALKKFEINKRSSIALGTQIGFNYTEGKNRTEANLSYINYRLQDLIISNSTLVLGTYYNSLHYGGIGNRFGFWAAMEIPIKEKLHIMAESIFAENALSFTSLGIIYYPIKWMPLTFGIQVPNTVNNAYSLVFELTILPLHYEKKYMIYE